MFLPTLIPISHPSVPFVIMSAKYEKLHSEEDGIISVEKISQSRLFITMHRVALTPWMIHAVLILFNALILVIVLWADQNTLSRCLSEPAIWDSSLTQLSRNPIQFESLWTLDSSSKYGGPPRPSLDEAWDRYTTNRWLDGTAVILSVSKEDIARARKIDDLAWLNTTVKLDNEEGGYMATIDMFHQLHCLNMIRKAVHRDYYESRMKFFHSQEFWEHIDHCFEALRQSLMCIGNTELITYHWVKDFPTPVPDFHVWHQCRDPEEVLIWAEDRAAHITSPITKHPGINELEERP
ncbi:hypothetical protein F5Y16DRAFT_140255 [Xylariaceae sp. FL0255]|nr:hypothetical protein F5Y16DRAFT_140255 [Xylariaceae sp. FL0255]